MISDNEAAEAAGKALCFFSKEPAEQVDIAQRNCRAMELKGVLTNPDLGDTYSRFCFGVACVFITHKGQLFDCLDEAGQELLADFTNRILALLQQGNSAEWSSSAVCNGADWISLRLSATNLLDELKFNRAEDDLNFNFEHLINEDDFITSAYAKELLS